VLIPSIDLMGGKIVQLIQGKKKALEFDDFEEWIERFSKFSMVQLIDLDAAIGSGDNRDILQHFLSRLPCQVGGGIRSIEAAQQVLDLGARRVILGSTLRHAFPLPSERAGLFLPWMPREEKLPSADGASGPRFLRSRWFEVLTLGATRFSIPTLTRKA